MTPPAVGGPFGFRLQALAAGMWTAGMRGVTVPGGVPVAFDQFEGELLVREDAARGARYAGEGELARYAEALAKDSDPKTAGRKFRWGVASLVATLFPPPDRPWAPPPPPAALKPYLRGGRHAGR